MKKREYFNGFTLLVAVLCLLTLALNMINGRFHLGDFMVYYTAAQKLAAGEQVYLVSFYTGSGCEQCGGTGRAGRVAIFELLSFREELRDRLMRGDPSQVLVEEAERLGMWSLREDGILKASQGLVDIREVLEATAPDGSVPE